MNAFVNISLTCVNAYINFRRSKKNNIRVYKAVAALLAFCI